MRSPNHNRSPKKVREQANRMILQLAYEYQEVILIPAPEPKHYGHMVRVAANRNPDWLFNTGLHRKPVSIALNRIRFNLPLYTEVDEVMLSMIQNMIIIAEEEELPF